MCGLPPHLQKEQMLIDFFFDFETRSRQNLKKVGSVKYAVCPSTEATLLTWCFGNGEVKAWRKGQPIPEEILHVARNPEKFHFVAHNVTFDYLIWTIAFAKLIPGLKTPPLSNITDNAALTNYARVTSALDSAASMLDLPYSKDTEGGRLMRKQSSPGPDGQFPELTPQEWERFEYYGVIDTHLLRDIYYKLPQLPEMERWGFEWTFLRNIKGVRIDMELLEVMEEILKVELVKLRKEFYALTGKFCTVTQRAKCLQFFQQYYPEMKDMQGETVRETLEEGVHVYEQVRRALEIYSLASSTSLAKVPTARATNYGGRMYNIWNFLKAHTRRWAGMGLQPQNFPRSKDIPLIPELNIENLAEQVRLVKDLQDDKCQMVKDLLRRLWLPDEGLGFYCGDFSKIEPTVLFWLLGMGALSKTWYEEMASEIYGISVDKVGKESEERQIGKNSALGCGYGLGYKGFMTQVKTQAGIKISEDLAKRAVNAYRRKHWQVPDFWKLLESAYISAIQGRTSALCGGKIYVMPMDIPMRGVQIRLPSGGFLFYPGARVEGRKISYKVFDKGRVRQEKIYGGLLTENVVSATARDIMLSSMRKLEESGFENLGTVHDEVWSQAVPGYGETFEQVMCNIPSWCGDMSVAVESKNGVRYLK